MVESRLGLKKEKLEAPREVMRQHSNTLSSCIIIVLEEMRRRSAERSMATVGEGLEWSGGCSLPLALASLSRPSSCARFPYTNGIN